MGRDGIPNTIGGSAQADTFMARPIARQDQDFRPVKIVCGLRVHPLTRGMYTAVSSTAKDVLASMTKVSASQASP